MSTTTVFLAFGLRLIHKLRGEWLCAPVGDLDKFIMYGSLSDAIFLLWGSLGGIHSLSFLNFP